jgi:Homeodomain-like domain-containing protein
MFAMHSPEIRREALALIAAGVNDCEIARRLGLARTTVRDMRRAESKIRPDTRERCARCWLPTSPVRFTAADYAELLGLYLGDRHISHGARAQRMRLSVFVNRTGRYEYLSYDFGNLSEDILDIFQHTCYVLGLHPRRTRRSVRLNRREDVALLLRHVGRKT